MQTSSSSSPSSPHEVLSQPAPKAPASSGGMAGELGDLIKYGLESIRAGVGDESTGEHSGKTWEFTSEFSSVGGI